VGKVAWDYIVPVKMPADLKGVEPGKLPAHLLVPCAGGGKLHWLCAAAWNAMVEKAKSEGLEMKPTSAGDTYRDYESQKRGFLSRYQLENNGSKTTRTFEGKTWYLKLGVAPMATPGKSNHNWGLAVDVHSAGEPKRLNWMIANVKEFGFSWEVVPVEPWHIRLVTGDNPTPAVRAYMERNGIKAPAAGSAPVASVASPDSSGTSGGDLKVGSKGPEVVALQNKLKEAGFYSGNADGDFGPKTNKAVKDFQKANGLKPDGLVGPVTKKKLGL
jgi:hypothetical protein